MLSQYGRSWKLTDFDSAIQLAPGEKSIIRSERFGTEGFTAPETISNGEYSFDSDWYSFGKTAQYILKQIEYNYMQDHEAGYKLSSLLGVLQLFADSMCHPVPHKRPLSSDSIANIRGLLANCDTNSFDS